MTDHLDSNPYSRGLPPMNTTKLYKTSDPLAPHSHPARPAQERVYRNREDAISAAIATLERAGYAVVGPDYDRVAGCAGSDDGYHVLSLSLCAACLEYPF